MMMTSLKCTVVSRRFFLCVLYLVSHFVTPGVDGAGPRPRRPIAEVDPDAIIRRSREHTRHDPEHTTMTSVPATTSSTPGGVGFDRSFSHDEPDFELFASWNYSSVEDEGVDEAGHGEEVVGELPDEDQGARLDELVLRLEEEEDVDAREMENELITDALAARRRPSSRLAIPKNKKPKKRMDIRSMFSPLSNKHKQRLLTMHNSYRRRSPGPASDMEEMVWDDELTLMSKKYAKKCIWAHGQAMDSKQFKHVGQNLAYGTSFPGFVMTPFYLATLWYQEKDYYNLATDTCEPGKICGHYTQMVWSDTNRLGCATHWCDELTVPGSSMVITDALYLVCNYGPGGNIHGHKPYDIGRPCTECASGSGKCRDGLCSDCSLRESSCDCMLKCENGGVLDSDNCMCSCTSGWMGPSCENVCNNTHHWCGNGWPRDWCFNKNDDNPVEELCPALCGVCECGGPPCLNGGSKGERSCSCECQGPWSGEDCSVCGLKCEHGSLDDSGCQCTCEDGWMGETCSEPCSNKHNFCLRGWYPNWCDEDHPYVLSNCPLMCGTCKMDTESNLRSGSCHKRCKNGGTLHPSECDCDCSARWFGDDCSMECRDKYQCSRWSSADICSNRDFARHYCPVSCGICSQTLDINE